MVCTYSGSCLFPSERVSENFGAFRFFLVLKLSEKHPVIPIFKKTVWRSHKSLVVLTQCLTHQLFDESCFCANRALVRFHITSFSSDWRAQITGRSPFFRSIFTFSVRSWFRFGFCASLLGVVLLTASPPVTLTSMPGGFGRTGLGLARRRVSVRHNVSEWNSSWFSCVFFTRIRNP